jgi:hypothetical protein
MIVDTDASRFMTNDRTDFVGKQCPITQKIQGLGSGHVVLEGTVCWSWEENFGDIHVRAPPIRGIVRSSRTVCCRPSSLLRNSIKAVATRGSQPTPLYDTNL